MSKSLLADLLSGWHRGILIKQAEGTRFLVGIAWGWGRITLLNSRRDKALREIESERALAKAIVDTVHWAAGMAAYWGKAAVTCNALKYSGV